MSTSPQETAKIYQFPVKNRLPVGGDRVDPRRAETPPHPTTTGDFGGAWYHEAAMQDSQQSHRSH